MRPVRTERRPLVDVGTGRLGAPKGSKEWALELRLHLTGLVSKIDSQPREIVEALELFHDNRAWTMVWDKYGDPFRTFDAFCEHEPPWGCGKPRREIEAALVAVLGDRGAQLVTVPPAETKQKENVNRAGLPGRPGPGRGHKKTDPAIMAGSVLGLGGPRTEQRVRAIADRSDERVKSLYKTGLLGGAVAAKLGPKNPSPETSERCTRIAIELAEEAKKLDTSTEALKRQAQRALNAKARELLGVRVDKVAAALRAFEALGADERERFLETGRTRGWWQ